MISVKIEYLILIKIKKSSKMKINYNKLILLKIN